MTNYIEPTQEHVGQVVEVRDRKDREWQQAKLTGILADDFKFAAKRDCDPSSWGWREARIPRPLTYAERQANCGLKVGDRVRVMTLPEAGQDGWKAGISGSMRHLVGTVHRITYMHPEYGFTVDGHSLPYFVLEKVEDRRATNKDFGKTVYIHGNPAEQFKMEFAYQAVDEPWRAIVKLGDKRFVYELSNLRVKE